MTHVEGHTPPTRRARKMFPRPRLGVDMVPPDAMLVGEVTEMSKRKPHAEDGYEQRFPLLDMQARARADDPDTSHDAADAMNVTGTTARHARRIIETLDGGGPSTGKEIAIMSDLTQHQVMRRVGELVESGLIHVVGKRDRQQVYALAQGGER